VIPNIAPIATQAIARIQRSDSLLAPFFKARPANRQVSPCLDVLLSNIAQCQSQHFIKDRRPNEAASQRSGYTQKAGRTSTTLPPIPSNVSNIDQQLVLRCGKVVLPSDSFGWVSSTRQRSRGSAPFPLRAGDIWWILSRQLASCFSTQANDD
jgi:hypothetical protein